MGPTSDSPRRTYGAKPRERRSRDVAPTVKLPMDVAPPGARSSIRIPGRIPHMIRESLLAGRPLESMRQLREAVLHEAR